MSEQPGKLVVSQEALRAAKVCVGQADLLDAGAVDAFENAVAETIQRAMKQAADERQEMWRPIETAPKDRAIDLWVEFPDAGYRWADARWMEEGEHNCSGHADWCSREGFPLHAMVLKPIATHWQPLPEPPVIRSIGKGGM